MSDGMCAHEFKRLYTQREFISEAGEAQALHLHCEHRDACWKGVEKQHFPPLTDESSHVSCPWVGPRYHALRLLCIGINLNQDSGLSLIARLVKAVKEEICSGRKRVNFGAENYGGSMLWYRMGCYAALFAQYQGLMDLSADGGKVPAREDVVQAFDFLAYTNHIKCSPHHKDGRPTQEMWRHCGRHVLRDEIAVLKPKHILVLGKSKNRDYFDSQILEHRCSDWQDFGLVMQGEGTVADKPVQIYAAYHPARRDSSAALQRALHA